MKSPLTTSLRKQTPISKKAIPYMTAKKSKFTYMKGFIVKYKKPIVITIGITVLNFVYGFDARFTLINLLWLIV